MDVPFGGGCACGAIRYEVSGAPVYMGNCHCRDCQQATGSAYFPAVAVRESDFTLLSGEPAWFERPADRGHPMHRAFCPSCGSPVFLINGASESVRVLYAGSLDNPGGYEPGRDIFVGSAQPWNLMQPDLPKDIILSPHGPWRERVGGTVGFAGSCQQAVTQRAKWTACLPWVDRGPDSAFGLRLGGL